MQSGPPKLHPSLEKILRQLDLHGESLPSLEQFQIFLKSTNSLLNDLTLDHELLEQSLKLASDEMEEHYSQMAQSAKMASLGEMAGNVAHEINNPLQILLSISQLLIQKLNSPVPPTPEFLTEKLAKVDLNVNRIAKIIKGLRTLSRDSSQDNFTSTQLREAMLETFSLCRAKVLDRGIDLRLPAEIPDLTFLSRPSQVSQVLINLVNNACDAIDSAEGTVTNPSENTPEKWIEIKINITDQHLDFQIEDSGPGVPPEIEQKIMNPFFTTKPVGKGTGLGLSVSSAIAKDHGGFLKLDRKIGSSCFVFRISRQLTEISSRRAA